MFHSLAESGNLGSAQKLSARDIWGKTIIKLREQGAVALHIACGDINDVEFVEDRYEIRTYDDFLYELLKSKENEDCLSRVLELFGIKDYEIIKKDKVLTKSQKDIIKLKEIFGENLIIEGE